MTPRRIVREEECARIESRELGPPSVTEFWLQLAQSLNDAKRRRSLSVLKQAQSTLHGRNSSFLSRRASDLGLEQFAERSGLYKKLLHS